MACSSSSKSLPRPLTALAVLIVASARVYALQTVDSSRCECFLTNGTVASYLDNHAFYDFRSLSQYQGVPSWITSESASVSADVTSDYFRSSGWTQFWQIQNWNNSGTVGKTENGATVLMVNSPNNVYIEANSDQGAGEPATWLTLRTMRLPDFQSAGEFDTISTGIQYLSMRMLARTIGKPGAVTAMFTYLEKGSGEEEADLEVLTRSPTDEIYYTNQPSVDDNGQIIPDSTQNETLPGGLSWSDWAIHRMDWTPGQSTWYVNGEQVANDSFQAPRDPSQVILNAWSDGSTWSGNMSTNDAAYLQVQWFEIVYNDTTKPVTGRNSCNVACSIDETNTTGSPVMLWDNAAPGRLSSGVGMLGWMAPLALVLFLCFGP